MLLEQEVSHLLSRCTHDFGSTGQGLKYRTAPLACQGQTSSPSASKYVILSKWDPMPTRGVNIVDSNQSGASELPSSRRACLRLDRSIPTTDRLCPFSYHEGEARDVDRSDPLYAAVLSPINWANRSRWMSRRWASDSD
jgi:hypothetical protein